METIKVADMRLIIGQDDDAQSPRELFENVGTMVCFHSRYTLGDEQPSCSPEEYLLEMMQQREWRLHGKSVPDEIQLKHVQAYIDKHYFILPLYLYDHSGITMKITPFSCRWDSGQVGFIYADKDCKDYDDMLAGLTSEVETYDKYLTGDVYFYQLEDSSGEVIDSCCGFYGFESCKAEALHIAQAYT